MAATGARIEPYSYSDNTAKWQSTHTLAVNLGGVAGVRHPTPMRLEDALASWKGLLDTAKPAGAPWALSYSSTTKRVTVASAGAVFSLVFPGNVGPWLGFTAGTLAGLATYTGDSAPAGLVQCSGVTAPLPTMHEQVDARAIRHGRSYSYAWGTVDTWEIEAIVDRTAYPWQAQRSLDSTDPAGGWATTGRVRVHQSAGDASAYSATRPSGYIDGFVSACDAEVVSPGEPWLRLRLTVVAPTASTGLAEPTGLWGALRYGWQPIYWLTVAGIRTVWTEVATGMTLPTGFASASASLAIDDSAAVGSTIDRSAGIGTGLPLTFRLLDSAALSGYMARPSNIAWLKADLSYNGLAITASDTSGFDASGHVHVGLECIEFSVNSGVGFTLATRGVAGSLACAHRKGTIGQVITDVPTVWTGRDVRLYAMACDPTGTGTGSTYASDSVEVWRGRMTGQATRQVGCWEFRADALDRILDRKLAGKVSGKIVGLGSAVKVNPAWGFGFQYEGLKSNYTNEFGPDTVDVFPFTAYTAGDVISAAEAISSMVSAWSAKVTLLGIGGNISTTLQVDQAIGTDGSNVLTLKPVVVAHANLALFKLIDAWWGAKSNKMAGIATGGWINPIDAQTVDKAIHIGWLVRADSPLTIYKPKTDADKLQAIQVLPDGGGASDIDSTGYLKIAAPSGSQLVAYNSATDVGGTIYFGLSPTDGQQMAPGSLLGCTAEVWMGAGPASIEALMLQAIQSSGAGTQGSYDLSQQGSGYAIDAVDEASFVAKIGTMGLKASVSCAGSSFAELFGGALALSQQAVVQRVGSGVVNLALVDTAPNGSAYTETITDWHLLAIDGEPVQSIERLAPPNTIICERITGADQGDQQGESDKVTAIDRTAVSYAGQVSESWSVPAESRAQLLQVVTARSASIFGAQQDCQAVVLTVVPWVAAQPGDLVRLVLTHPLLWSFEANSAGFTGIARVTGRAQRLATGEVELTCLLEGRAAGVSLCPSALIISTDNTLTPTRIDVPAKFLSHFTAALANGTCVVLHYIPGTTEGTTSRFTVTAAAMSGAYCRLTISTVVGAVAISTTGRSAVTLPAEGAAYASTYQDGFAHVDDGTRWL